MAEETRAEKARRIAKERIAAGESKVAQSTFEVSTKGNQLGKEFSALNATFKEGRFAGKTIEEVWQNDIKKSSKGRPPSSDSILFGKPIEDLSPLLPRKEFSDNMGIKLYKDNLKIIEAN